MEELLNILVIDTNEQLLQFIGLLKNLSLNIELNVVKNFFPAETFIKEQNFDCVFFSCQSDKEFLAAINLLGSKNIIKVIAIVDKVSLGKELNKLGAGNYLLKIFLDKKEVVEQIIENTLRFSRSLNISKAEISIYKDEIEKINKEYNDFTYVISHDLHAPLRAIRNISEWIEEDLGGSIGKDTQDNLKLLRGRVGRLEALIDGVLQYSRIQRIKSPSQLVDLSSLLGKIVSSLDKPKEFSVFFQTNMPKINTFKEKIEQVLFHLIKNSVQFRSSDEGFVRVLVSEETKFYHFTLADNGQGIAPEYQKKVFEIFQTLSSKSKIESVGIGLTLVKKIIETVGGEIKLESKLGEGCTFHFWWPK